MERNENAKIARYRLIENAVNKAPEGYVRLVNAATAPVGYTWYSNNKSLFSKDRKTILVKDADK